MFEGFAVNVHPLKRIADLFFMFESQCSLTEITTPGNFGSGIFSMTFIFETIAKNQTWLNARFCSLRVLQNAIAKYIVLKGLRVPEALEPSRNCEL